VASKAPTITHQSLGAWLIKGSRDVYPVDDLVRTRFATVTSWSLRKTYRTRLIESGQPVLFWISGEDDEHPAGIYAQGYTSGRAFAGVADSDWVDVAERGKKRLFMPVELKLLDSPILRTEILDHPVLSQIEVVKMPAGSNPSFLSKTDLQELRRMWPHVTVA
jgi:hypothetical protein